MIFLALLAAAALAAAPEATPAVPAAASPAAAAASHSADDDKIICKTEEVTGSRFSTRVCNTKAGWDAKARAARDYLDSNTRLSHCPNGMC